MIVHLITQVELTAAKSAGTIAPESLTTEGFMHCSAPHQALVTATRFYPTRSDLVAVLIEDSKLGDMLRWEPPAHPDGSPPLPGEEFFPHLYSALEFDAVRDVLPLSWVGTQYEGVAPLHPFRIVALADHPNLWQQAAEWSFAAWRHEFPQDTVQTYLDQYALAANPGERLVEVYAALGASDRLLGLSTLVDDDELPGATEPGPWLAAVLTLPEHRSLGVASALIHRIIQRAHALGHANLYLYTSDQQEWYAKKGWIPARETELNGIAHTVMRLPLQI